MYKFETDAFGSCIAHPRKQYGAGAESLEIIEIETFHGFSSVVSTYRFERRATGSGRPSQLTEAAICRLAVAQFLHRNRAVHIARAEALDMKLPKFKGKLTPMGDNTNRCARTPKTAPTY